MISALSLNAVTSFIRENRLIEKITYLLVFVILAIYDTLCQSNLTIPPGGLSRDTSLAI
jgi:hypothetical protein